MRYLGVDFGTKKVGLALSDEAGRMGFPHKVVLNAPALLEEVCTLIKNEKVGGVVIGESKNYAGLDNPIAASARAFGDEVGRRTGAVVAYEPEMLTSAEARRTQERQEKSRAPKSRDPIDASAAALILTSYLSRHTQ